MPPKPKQMRSAAEEEGEAEAEGVRRQFEKVVGRVRGWSEPAVKPNDQLVLYGLYKQASFGDCRSQQPGLFDPTGRAKWSSWKSYEGTDELEAKRRYCRVAEVVCPDGTAAGGEENHAGLAEARVAIDTNGHAKGRADGDLDRDHRPAAPHLHHSREAHGNEDGELGRQETETNPTSSVPLPQNIEHLRRQGGKGEGRFATQVDDCSSMFSPSGREGSASGDDGFGGLRIAGVATVAVVAMLSVAAALGGEDHHGQGGERGIAGSHGAGAGEGSDDVSRMARGWSGAAPLLLFSTSAAVAAVFAVVAACLWCAVRLARWREEIFAGSPVVTEVFSRAAALDHDGSRGDYSSPSADPLGFAGSGGSDDSGSSSNRSDHSPMVSTCDGNSVAYDPVGNMFRPGTRAAHDFYAPCLVAETVSTGPDSSSPSVAAAATTVEDGNGAVVFLTGVTGLVGQMVLFDLLRQGAAAAKLASADGFGDDTKEKCSGESLASGGLRRVVVLVRSKKGMRPSDRLASIRDSPMFRPLRESGAWMDESDTSIAAGAEESREAPLPSCPSSTTDAAGLGLRRTSGRGTGAVVTAVEGELEKEGLGLTSEARALLVGARVTHALHCAASVSFSNPLAEAAATNVTGALRVAALVASWPSCGTLVHVSTAFVHGGKLGTASSPLPQQLPDLGGKNPERLYRSAQSSRAVGGGDGDNAQSASGPGKEAVKAMADLGYLNTYAFTKALGEHLLARALSAHNRKVDKSASEKDGDGDGRERGTRGAETDGRDVAHSPGPRRLRLRVVRPSIVGPSWVFPWPGWTGEQPSTVTGCLVLCLQRAIKTFRLGPHPAPVIPVDVVSRAIVHSALGWGGPLTTTAAAPRVQVVDSISRRRPRDLSGSNGGQGGNGPSESSCPDVMVRNLVWATHPVVRGDGACATEPQKRSEAGGGDGDDGDADISAPGANEAAGDGGEGRMPSFREFSGLLYDYAVLRGLRPSFEALAMMSSFAAASVLPEAPLAMPPGGRAQDGAPGGRREGELRQKPTKHGRRGSSRLVFDAMHLLLDRSPVWALQGALTLATWVKRLGVSGGGNKCDRGNGNMKGMSGAGAIAMLRRLDKLAELPAVYDAFTWPQYFFDSALRVPGDLTPEGYALETALASELLQQSLPGGATFGLKASPQRRRAILRELCLQIQTHRSGGLRCGGTRGKVTSDGGVGGLVCVRDGADCDSEEVYTDPKGRRQKTQRHRDGGPLSLLCGSADRLVPWPALAWWAATLPGSAARGGVTAWVRFVAFAVRVVMSRAASAVAVDVESFRAAAPPGHGAGATGGVGSGVEVRRLRRGDVIAGGADSGEDDATRVRVHQVEGCGGMGKGNVAVVGIGSERSWPTGRCEPVAREKGEGGGKRVGEGAEGGGGAAEKVVVVLLPTHRSYLDFVLVSLFCASMRSLPGLTWLRVPKVAAADGPFGKEGTPLRWLMEKLGAFFVRRGNAGEPHSALQRRLRALQEGGHESAEGDQSCRTPSEGEAGGVTSSSSALARKLQGHGLSSDAARRTPISGEERAKARGVSRGGRPGTGVASGGKWPGPCDSDPRQKGLETVEVFVEGTRSRDRRFLAPKTGLIRALQGAREGATLWLVPVSISYERVPEQARLAEELVTSRDIEGSQGGGYQGRQQQQSTGAVGLTGLLRWTMKTLSGRVRLGRVLMRAEDPVVLCPGGDVKTALLEVRRRHRLGTVVTPYHIREAAEHLGLDMEDVRECVQELGGTVWDEDDGQENPFSRRRGSPDQTTTAPPLRYASDIQSAERRISAAEPASNDTEAWMNHLQWLHLLEGKLRGGIWNGDASRQLARWVDWLVPPPRQTSGSAGTREEKEGDEEGASDVRGDLGLLQAQDVGACGSSIGATIASDAAYGIDVFVDITDRPDIPATSAAADTRETTETAMNSPRSAESSSSSSTPSWVMANDSSTDSSLASSAPCSFEVTPLVYEDNRAAAAPSAPALAAPTSSTSPSPFEAATYTKSASSVNSSDGSDRVSGPRNTVRHGDEAPSASDRVLTAIMREFDLAEEAVAEARQTLLDKGFSHPSRGHLLQVLLRNVEGDSRGWDRVKDSVGTNNTSGRSRVPGCGGTVPPPSVFLASVALSLNSDAGSLVQRNASPNLANSSTTTAVAGAASQRGSGDDADEGESWFGAVDGDKEAVGSWGFRDSGFCIESDRADGGDPYVVMRGNRYGVCGRPLRGLLPFVREAVAVPISADGKVRRATSPPQPFLPPSRLLLKASRASLDAGCAASGGDCSGVACTTTANGIGGESPAGGGGGKEEGEQETRTLLESMVEALGPGFDTPEQVSFSEQERARHGAGHGLSDIWSLRSGQLRRAPDAVVWPTSEDQVSRLMEWAGQEGVCLIPFGGGTSVTRALEVPPLEVEPRPVVSVDMRKMCHVLEVDVANGTAHIQAGVVGRTMAKELANFGVTMGHEPDSLEFSTLGGWVATRASGMKRGRYGNIEDMVLEVRVVTGRGVAWQHSDRAHSHPNAAGAFSRTSVGLDLATAMLGSEGCLGIITSVVVKVVPLPAVSEHASFLFKDFQTGVAFCRELSRTSSRLGLASCRLLDNRQLRLGKAMKGEEESDTNGFLATLKALVPKAQSAYIRIWKGWEWAATSGVTMVFEGSRHEVNIQRSEVSRIARSHGGLSGGASAGKSGYDLTFAIAYLRDFALLFDVLGESFETFVSWTALEGLCDKVRERVRMEHRKRGLRGDAFVTHRVTQLYPEGACVYFYLAIYAQGVCNPTGVFAELEEAARDEILVAGGSLSHHHGIGKSRAGFLSRVSSPVVSNLVLGMKQALDPHNVLGARNHLLAAEESSADGGRAS